MVGGAHPLLYKEILYLRTWPLGDGGKIITNQYLGQFGDNTEDAPAFDLAWGKEVENLAPAIFSVLDPSEPLPIHPRSDEKPSFDLPVYATLGAEIQNVDASLKDKHGFKPRDGDKGWPSARRAELVFSKESIDLLSYMKTQPYTLTVLGYALAPPMLCLPVSLFMSPEGAPLPLEKSVLLKVMDGIRERYAAHKKSAVAYVGQLCDMFVQVLKQGYAADQSLVNQCYNFSSDGAGEKFLDSTFEAEKGKTLFDVSKFFISIDHTHPGPYFRLSSWKGTIDIGADFNRNLISAEEIGVYLAKRKEFMLLIMT
ncbi:hypothetical protein B0H17DRAFT_1146213 [Mycena rosella]|uniref:Uncharacterized protein n=1 Tax=Mycena rosella TaxID=1033263 RepID=A0AAD7CPD4_MYCRO|nr:hypothetical protein B0H17DRAFT_1146213 [Mycena rosella]